MPDLVFSQPATRNFTAPILIALAVLGIAFGLFFGLAPHSIAAFSVKNTAVYSSHLVFKSDSLVVGSDTFSDETYVLVTLHAEDKLSLPIFIKDMTATITPANPDGSPAEPITTNAVEKLDVPNLYATFPALKALADKQNTPLLLRETELGPGKPVEGLVLIHFPVDQQNWNQRKSATLNIVLYQQDPILVTIPKP